MRLGVLTLTSMFSAALIAAVGLQAPHAASNRGPHGGELRKVAVPSGAAIEVLIKSSAAGKEIHVYGVDAQNKTINLANSGYGGIVFKLGDLELSLRCDKVGDDGHISNADDRREHYLAVGKFPASAKVELEVTVAFPGKLGTGHANFRPFPEQDDSWR